MANCINYNCFDDPLDVYTENECAEELVGGVSAVIFLECNHLMTSPTAALINIELAANRATLVTGCYASIEPPSPVETDSIVACRPSKVTNYNRSGVYKNPNVSSANVDFHKPIFAGRTFGGLILYECGTAESRVPQITWIDRAVTFTGGRILPGVTSEKQRFEGTFKYLGLHDDDIYAVPPGIFTN